MWLVLAPLDDLAALWAYQGLRARRLEPLELISAEMLACTLRWEHRLGEAGIDIDFTLADGRRIQGSRTCGTLNRLILVPSDPLQGANPADQEYASQELTAFFMSWLHALPRPVMNLPTSQGLSGAWRHASEWVSLAVAAGLPTAPYFQSSENPHVHAEAGLARPAKPVTTLTVIGKQVVGAAVPPGIAEGCRRLAALSDTAILGVDFAPGEASAWTFVGATPRPDLRSGGDALLDALLDTLRAGGPVTP